MCMNLIHAFVIRLGCPYFRTEKWGINPLNKLINIILPFKGWLGAWCQSLPSWPCEVSNFPMLAVPIMRVPELRAVHIFVVEVPRVSAGAIQRNNCLLQGDWEGKVNEQACCLQRGLNSQRARFCRRWMDVQPTGQQTEHQSIYRWRKVCAPAGFQLLINQL